MGWSQGSQYIGRGTSINAPSVWHDNSLFISRTAKRSEKHHVRTGDPGGVRVGVTSGVAGGVYCDIEWFMGRAHLPSSNEGTGMA